MVLGRGKYPARPRLNTPLIVTSVSCLLTEEVWPEFVSVSQFSIRSFVYNQWRTQKIFRGWSSSVRNQFRGSAEGTTILGGSGGMPPGKFCKITPKNTHFCAFWKQVLDNTVFTFFIFSVWGSGHGTVASPLRTLVFITMGTWKLFSTQIFLTFQTVLINVKWLHKVTRNSIMTHLISIVDRLDSVKTVHRF